MFAEHIVLSRDGSQQGDPMSVVEFCDAIHPTLQKCEARTKLGYMDAVKLEAQVQVVASDVHAIIDAYSETGLRLNPSKCEIVCSNVDILNEYPVFKEFNRVKRDDLTILGAPVQKGKAVDKALDIKITEFKTAI